MYCYRLETVLVEPLVDVGAVLAGTVGVVEQTLAVLALAVVHYQLLIPHFLVVQSLLY